MSTVSVPNTKLKAGDVLALPFGRTATITSVAIGHKYVSITTSEYPVARILRHDESLVVISDEGVES